MQDFLSPLLCCASHFKYRHATFCFDPQLSISGSDLVQLGKWNSQPEILPAKNNLAGLQQDFPLVALVCHAHRAFYFIPHRSPPATAAVWNRSENSALKTDSRKL